MAVRIKSRWHNDEIKRSPEAIGSAVAFNGWKIAVDRMGNLQGEHYRYDSDEQRLWVVAEYCIYMVQIVDRLAHSMIDDQERAAVITAMALKFGEYLQENAADMVGPGDHVPAFIQRLNERSAEYAEFGLGADGPSYPFLRHLGAEIQRIMGDEGGNRWVIDQVMDQDGPEIFKQVKRLVYNLLD